MQKHLAHTPRVRAAGEIFTFFSIHLNLSNLILKLSRSFSVAVIYIQYDVPFSDNSSCLVWPNSFCNINIFLQRFQALEQPSNQSGTNTSLGTNVKRQNTSSSLETGVSLESVLWCSFWAPLHLWLTFMKRTGSAIP